MSLSSADKLYRNLFLGFIRLHILYHAQKEEIFGLSMIQELARHGYAMSPGTLYPMLHQMERDGFLCSDYVMANGKRRKCYRVTPEGSRALALSYEKIAELSGELHEDEYEPIARRVPSGKEENNG
jgi:DNA-binding PadR family transcriptional regulator